MHSFRLRKPSSTSPIGPCINDQEVVVPNATEVAAPRPRPTRPIGANLDSTLACHARAKKALVPE